MEPSAGVQVTWSWLAFGIGIITAFGVSFLAMVGWWFLTIGRHNKRAQAEIAEDFQRVRDAVARARRN